MDGKKKELIGDFYNSGRSWLIEPDAVNVHDFRQDAVGRAVPYGIYDWHLRLASTILPMGYVYVGKRQGDSLWTPLPCGGIVRVELDLSGQISS